MWSDGSMIARTRQSVVEGCWGCEGCCTSAVQHEGLVDGAESVNFMIGALETGLQLAFDGFEVLDVAGSSFKEGDFAGLLVRWGKRLFEARVPFPELIAPVLLGLNALLANSFAARVTRGRVVVSSNGSRFELLVVVVIGIVVAPARPSLVSGTGAGPVLWHSDGVVAMGSWNSGSVRNSGW